MRWLADRLGDLIAVNGFVSKEIGSVLLQPRLILSLVVGPFLIMVAFGLGYRGPHPEFRTILVVPTEPAIAQRVDLSTVYQEGLTGVFKLESIMNDREAALAKLRQDQADVIVVVPEDLFQRVYGGERAVLDVYYTETDPTSNAWVRYFTSVQTSELNRRILVDLLGRTKDPAEAALEYTDTLLDELDAIEADLREGDYQRAISRTDRLLVSTDRTIRNVSGELDTLSNVLGESVVERDRSRQLLLAIQQELRALRGDLGRGAPGQPSSLERIQTLRTRARELVEIASHVNRLPVDVLVSPLAANTHNVAPVEPTAVAFYTPAVLALLLQHIGVTLGALSSVRDRLLGSLELFRVSPIGAVHILVGKSLGFALIMAVVGAALTAALIVLLDVPLLGSPVYFVLTIAVTIFAAIGLGFAVSTFAETETQAVQLAMLVLLTSVFFGGFFLPTRLLYTWVLSVSYSLPVSYGAINLRDLMLRGADPAPVFLIAPLALGTAFYAVAMLGLHRQMRRA